MPPHEAVASDRSLPATSRPFTLRRANHALVLVRKVVADVVTKYRELSEFRAALGRIDDADDITAERDRLKAGSDACVEMLNRLYRELLDVGCILKDWRIGLVDFPAVLDGRRVWLCWRLGEAEVAWWHELNDGYANRKAARGRFSDE
jgi:hypothetical protein